MNCIWASLTCSDILELYGVYEASIMVLFDGHKIFVWWDPFHLYLKLLWRIWRPGLFWEHQAIVTTDHTSCLERSRILLSVFVILSKILRLDHCDRRMTKQIINNFPDLDLKDILHNSAVTTRRTPFEMIFLITLIAPIVISKLFPSLFFPPKIALGHKHETMNTFYHSGFAFW